MLLDQTVTFASAHDKPRMRDAAVLRQRAKVRLDPEAPPLVTVALADGSRLIENVSAVRGTNANPMTREEVMAKARGLMTPVLGAPSSAKLIEATLAIESLRNVRELRPLLQRG
jgi:hypothetical protein